MKPSRNAPRSKGKKTDSTEGMATSSDTVLVVSLWVGLDPGGKGSAPAELPVSALAMVEDLLRAARGEIRGGPEAAISASFKDIWEAIRAVRYLQRLVHGYGLTSPSGPLAACYTLAAPQDEDRLREAVTLNLQNAQAQNETRRALVVGSLCAEAKGVSGLVLKDFFLFAKDEDESSFNTLELLTPAGMPNFPEAAINRAASRPETPATSQGPPSSTHGSRPGTEASSPAVGVRPMAQRAPWKSAIRRLQSLFTRSKAPRWWIGLGATGLILILLIVGALMKVGRFGLRQDSGYHSAKAALPPPQAAPLENKPVQVIQNGDAVVRTPHSERNKPPSVEKNQAIKSNQRDLKKNDTDATDDKTCASSVSFDLREAENMIQQADRDSGDGKYEEAIRIYNRVLCHFRSNAAAKRGLERTQQKMGNP